MVTQAQIAAKLGVSRQLVTFALSGHPHVAKDTREMIFATAEEMGYRPNPHARALKKKFTGILALWIPGQISTHYSHVSRAFGRLVKEAKLELIVSEIHGTDIRQIWSNVPVDGIFVVDASEEALQAIIGMTGNSVPVVAAGMSHSPLIDSVQIDLVSATAEAMRHLIHSGYRRIAHATYVTEDDPKGSRRTEYIRTMREAGLEPEFILYPLNENQREITRELIKQYISTQGLPEAIFCQSDDVAIGIYRGLCDLKIRVPNQVALVGCDGIEDTKYLETPLSTILQPVPEMCAKAWEFLKERIADPTLPPRHEVLVPTLAIRESSRRGS